MLGISRPGRSRAPLETVPASVCCDLSSRRSSTGGGLWGRHRGHLRVSGAGVGNFRHGTV